jgi:high-affinity nickel-transport protein
MPHRYAAAGIPGFRSRPRRDKILRMSTLALLGLGFALGLRHAADPDHVIAVTAIASRYKRVWPAARVGAVWGLGHTLTLAVVGCAIILFNLAVPPRVALAFEFAVGIALTVVGMLNVAGSGGFAADADPGSGIPSLRAFAMGLVHGLAGSAAVALLVLATVREPVAGCMYLLVFGVGTLLGMTLITVSLASPVALASRRWSWSGQGLRLATGLVSLAFGAYVMFQTGWVEGLFGRN